MKPNQYELHRQAWKDSGWANLILPLIEDAEILGAHILQIKEKFGGLRFYYGLECEATDLTTMAIVQDFRSKVDEAEEASYRICEECGEPGTRGGAGWIRTLCAKHHEEYEARKR